MGLHKMSSVKQIYLRPSHSPWCDNLESSWTFYQHRAFDPWLSFHSASGFVTVSMRESQWNTLFSGPVHGCATLLHRIAHLVIASWGVMEIEFCPRAILNYRPYDELIQDIHPLSPRALFRGEGTCTWSSGAKLSTTQPVIAYHWGSVGLVGAKGSRVAWIKDAINTH